MIICECGENLTLPLFAAAVAEEHCRSLSQARISLKACSDVSDLPCVSCTELGYKERHLSLAPSASYKETIAWEET